MNVAAQEPKPIQFREVYLSDLNAIVQLYRKNQSLKKVGSAVKNKLAADFGLPIGVAEQDKKIVAYSVVKLTSSGEAVITVQADTDFKTAGINEQLNSFSVHLRSNKSLQNNTVVSERAVQQEIDRFIDWLNQCYLN
ncbi:hypothetical protein [Flavobacterium sp. UBA4197]|uniref:hypothetical protein n=1 Tax=Flavobacterium sp. UBA4197 TaxID=1946546 RepID=UPI00257EB836|nr:hypothetical protein [Flavobacterium sp. UBA4197]